VDRKRKKQVQDLAGEGCKLKDKWGSEGLAARKSGKKGGKTSSRFAPEERKKRGSGQVTALSYGYRGKNRDRRENRGSPDPRYQKKERKKKCMYIQDGKNRSWGQGGKKARSRGE